MSRQPFHNVVSLGEALFDQFGDRAVLGGAPLNLAVHAHSLLAPLGGQALLVSRVGRDELGDTILSDLSSRGLNTDCIQQDGQYPTGVVRVERGTDGGPIYDIVQDVAWDRIKRDPKAEDAALGCSAIYFGTLAQRSKTSRQTISHLLKTADNAIKILDVNLRQSYFNHDILSSSFESATVVKLSEEELPVITELLSPNKHTPSTDDQVRSLCEIYHLDALALTRGAKGTVLFQHGCKHEGQPAPFNPVKGADSVGAGDACCAGLICGLILGRPAQCIVDLANALGAYVAGQKGATPTLPDHLLDLIQLADDPVV